MRCSRCGSLMSCERFTTMEGGRAAEPYEAWRCLSCGEILDPVILKHRQRLKGLVLKPGPAHERQAA
ncbi:MAG: hypothetical protein AB1515_04150 [Nitrospirota bacterium]